MFTRCANPSCSHPYVYKRGSCAFRVSSGSTVHFYWLCEHCLPHVMSAFLSSGVHAATASAIRIVSLDDALGTRSESAFVEDQGFATLLEKV